MLIDLRALNDKYNLKVDGVLHIGAHHGEEADVYDELGFKPVWWLEANPYAVEVLEEKFEYDQDNHVLDAVVSNVVDEEVQFNLANNGESSSMLEFGTHSQEHPEVVFIESLKLRTTTIDTLREEEFIGDANFVNLDIQGAELLALRGAESYLTGVDYIYTEVNKKQLYVGCALLRDVDTYLGRQGFKRVELEMTRHGWGDAFYVRRS